jgi:hypothetical protein
LSLSKEEKATMMEQLPTIETERSYPMACRLFVWTVTAVVALSTFAPALAEETPEWEVGGPLAGMKLPAYKTYHGEPAGHPGGSTWDPPQVELYPGSVENWRAYHFKWMPTRSLFDRQSMLKNWVAPAIPGAPARAEQYAQPVWNLGRQGGHTPAGTTEPPVEVIRVKAGETILAAGLGELPQGLYCLRVVAAVPTELNTDFRKNLFVTLTVNDRLDGGNSTYRGRIGYCDQFYCVAEFYFHAVVRRTFQATLSLDPASEVPLVVRNVTLDDVLAGIQRGAHKKKSNDPFPAEWTDRIKQFEAKRTTDPAAIARRWERDAVIWESYPHLNSRYDHNLNSPGSGLRKRAANGAGGLTAEQIAEQFGTWTADAQYPPRRPGVFLHNAKLDLDYTFADYNAGKPLPDPFPVKDDGNGVFSANPDGKTGTTWSGVALSMQSYRLNYQGLATAALGNVQPQPGRSAEVDADAVRDGLIRYLRVVYDLPACDNLQDLGNIVCQEGGWGRSFYDRQRETQGNYYTWYTEYANFADFYDKYYDLIKDNQPLADSLHRFLPWIKTPQDVIELCDTYLVQVTAKRILRYHYIVYPDAGLRIATLLGEPKVTRPWMEWVFSRTFVYPLPLMGIQHLMGSAYDPSGIEFGRSTYYGTGENASNLVDATEKYCEATGDHSFSMNDPARYPKGRAALQWPLDMFCAGWQAMRIGDVTGPDKAPASFLTNCQGLLRKGWDYTRDRCYAAILVHMGWTKGYLGKELEELQAAAAEVKRMPWFESQSHVAPNWAGILEGGTQHDDIRFRRSVMVRTGWGSGHHHQDALDLQVCAFGQPMITDAGQRPGYTKPASGSSTVHNAVTVTPEGQPMRANHVNSWVRSLQHTPELAYLEAHSGEPTNLDRGRRQVALVNVDEGRGAQALPVDQQKPGVKLDRDVTLPESYVFDVVRTAGAGTHRYNFHAMVNDQFQWNATAETPDPTALNGEFTRSADQTFRAAAPETLIATWRQRREPDEKERICGTESMNLEVNYDPASPAKFVRLQLLGLKDATAARGELVSVNPPCPTFYHFTCMGAERKAAAAGSCYVALIEPHAGEPFIKSAGRLPIADNPDDAQMAVAVAVETTAGTRDLLLADGKSGADRCLTEPSARFRAEFAWQTSDPQGLRSAGLVGGTLLETPQIRVRVPAGERAAAITRVDYRAKQVVIDAAWPEVERPVVVEIGPPGRKVPAVLLLCKPSGSGRTVLTFAQSAQRIHATAQLDEKLRAVRPGTDLMPGPLASEQKGWTITNADLSKVWRADFAHGAFVLASPLAADDFGREPEVCVWDYGVGDTVRMALSTDVRRVDAGVFEIRSQSDAVVELPGLHGALRSADGSETSLQAKDGWIACGVAPGVTQLKVGP